MIKEAIFILILLGVILHFNLNSNPNPIEPTTTIEDTMYKNEFPSQSRTYDEAKAYCQNLEFSGYQDWQLPSAVELDTLSRNAPWVKNIQKNWWFWSSETRRGRSHIVYLHSSKSAYHYQTRNGMTLCIRRLRIFDKNAPIVDREAMIIKKGNIWYQNRPFDTKYRWQEAKDYCTALELGGDGDWRLATIEELKALGNVEYQDFNGKWRSWYEANKHQQNSNAQQKGFFLPQEWVENMRENGVFWSATPSSQGHAKIIHFHGGLIAGHNKDVKNHAMCVRLKRK
ncbi:MAG: DUF1566 domain-containing protein [Campylobacterota bacterium]|nr:DUF1566 domain-containing protein [Campylobacterota bacterium]